jgi:hypothetical protein
MRIRILREFTVAHWKRQWDEQLFNQWLLEHRTNSTRMRMISSYGTLALSLPDDGTRTEIALPSNSTVASSFERASMPTPCA